MKKVIITSSCTVSMLGSPVSRVCQEGEVFDALGDGVSTFLGQLTLVFTDGNGNCFMTPVENGKVVDVNMEDYHFVKYARKYARGGSLREVFINFFIHVDHKAMPQDNRECRDVIMAAMDAYFEERAKKEVG